MKNVLIHFMSLSKGVRYPRMYWMNVERVQLHCVVMLQDRCYGGYLQVDLHACMDIWAR